MRPVHKARANLAAVGIMWIIFKVWDEVELNSLNNTWLERWLEILFPVVALAFPFSVLALWVALYLLLDRDN